MVNDRLLSDTIRTRRWGGVMARQRTRRNFGQITKLPSGRWRARYTGPDLVRHPAPYTFETKMDAEAWLVAERRVLTSGEWVPPKQRPRTVEPVKFGDYATAWLEHRALKPRTRAHYDALLESRIRPRFGDLPVPEITPEIVRTWYAGLGSKTPTANSHAYGLLRTILTQAVHDGVLVSNPCHIRGAGNAKRVHKVRTATLDELAALTEAIPARYKLMVLLAAWTGLRFGELTELRRKDIDLKHRVIKVRRGVVRVKGEVVVSTPKSEAGVRDVAIPPHLLDDIKDHFNTLATAGQEGLLFPAATDSTKHLNPSSLSKVFNRAKVAAGRPDLRWHDLRHTGATLAAGAGATLADLMSRLGHSTPAAALRYQHAVADRDRVIAEALSELVALSEQPSE